MEHIFLAYANSEQSPLATLREEDAAVNKTLANRAGAGHFLIRRESFATIPDIAYYLTKDQAELVLFSYSGHAGHSELLLGDGPANANGIAQMLGRCPKLKLVLLNGCSTQGQVKALLDAGVPAVIATSAPVGDRAATQFAITFFQALSDHCRTIGQAFEDGIAAAQAQSASPLHAQTVRGIPKTAQAGQEASRALWRLHCREESDLDWMLPAAPPSTGPAKAIHQQAEKIYNIDKIDNANFS